MGIFDIIEMKQHCRAIGEYLLYMDAHPADAISCHQYIRDHLKNLYNVLDNLEKDS